MERKHRRQLIVDPTFQIRFILRFCMGVIITSLLIGGAVYLLTRGSTTVAIENTKVIVKPTADFILPILSATVLIVAFFSGLGVLVLALFVSHRIAGPAFRLQREVVRMKEGDMVRDFKIRDKDQLQSLAQSLSLMSETFCAKHRALREATDTLTRYLEEKDYCVSPDDKEELCKTLGKVRNTLSYFRL